MNLFEEQVRIERNMVASGAAIFRATHENAVATGNASRSRVLGTVLDALIVPVMETLAPLLGDQTGKGKGRRPPAFKLMAPLGVEVIAYISIRLLIDRCFESRPWASLALSLGKAIETEVRMVGFAAQQPQYAATLLEDLNNRTDNQKFRSIVYRTVLAKHPDDEPGAWSNHEIISVGSRLLDIAVASSAGLFEITRFTKGKLKSLHVAPTERFFSWVGSLKDQLAALNPFYAVCVVPPKDWDSLYGGGYHTDALAYPLSLVKTRSKTHREALKHADLSKVYRAVNLVQRTPWAIQKEVLEVAQALLDADGGVAGLPLMVDEPLPAKPENFHSNPEANREWRHAATKVYDKNRRELSKRVAALRTLAYAKDAQKYDQIFFPYQADFRGRLYSVPRVLSPQGADLSKALLVFAEGDPVVAGTPAADWLYVHGANCAGVDKVSFGDRKEWVQINLPQILRTADEPLETIEFWGSLDSPFKFLSWAFEFAKWYRDRSYRPRVPIAQDGTCNGLQHYAALLRDPIAGAAVNLTPSVSPSDIYAEVANVVSASIGSQSGGVGELWKRLGITRHITKRPVMILPYGGTYNACSRYIEDAVLERYGPEVAANTDAVKLLSQEVWKGIGEVVVSARLAMTWIQQVAGAVTKAGRPLQWTSPSGFVIVQDYENEIMERVNLYLMSGRVQTAYTEKTGELSAARQRNGSAPNFVHSLDAAALVGTVCLAGDAGLTKFAVIHDSFGTTAGHSEELAKLTRVAFVDLYNNYSLEDYGNDNGWIGDPPPFIGGLDIEQVKNSEYFFN